MDSFFGLGSYLPDIAPLIAIINSVIAVSVSHFRPEERKTKKVFLSAAIILGILAAGSTIGNQFYINKQHEEAKKEKNRKIDDLGNFIQKGDIFLSLLRDNSGDFKEIDSWAHSVEIYLSHELGKSYANRFRDASGMMHGVPPTADQVHQNYWNGVYERTFRLEQFSSELSLSQP